MMNDFHWFLTLFYFSSAFIHDNAGFEFFSDLVLADLLCTSQLATNAEFYVKKYPWFVSDTTKDDVEYMLATMSQTENLKELAARWRNNFSSGKWTVDTDMFCTLPRPYCDMEKYAPDFYAKLSQSKLVVLKGDLNYRKMLGDINWEYTTALKIALQGFHPTALVTLRTLKADLVVGLAKGVADKIGAKNEDWMVSGEYGVVQFVGKN
jgi:hypothetical protein